MVLSSKEQAVHSTLTLWQVFTFLKHTGRELWSKEGLHGFHVVSGRHHGSYWHLYVLKWTEWQDCGVNAPSSAFSESVAKLRKE